MWLQRRRRWRLQHQLLLGKDDPARGHPLDHGRRRRVRAAEPRRRDARCRPDQRVRWRQRRADQPDRPGRHFRQGDVGRQGADADPAEQRARAAWPDTVQLSRRRAPAGRKPEGTDPRREHDGHPHRSRLQLPGDGSLPVRLPRQPRRADGDPRQHQVVRQRYAPQDRRPAGRAGRQVLQRRRDDRPEHRRPVRHRPAQGHQVQQGRSRPVALRHPGGAAEARRDLHHVTRQHPGQDHDRRPEPGLAGSVPWRKRFQHRGRIPRPARRARARAARAPGTSGIRFRPTPIS